MKQRQQDDNRVMMKFVDPALTNPTSLFDHRHINIIVCEDSNADVVYQKLVPDKGMRQKQQHQQSQSVFVSVSKIRGLYRSLSVSMKKTKIDDKKTNDDDVQVFIIRIHESHPYISMRKAAEQVSRLANGLPAVLHLKFLQGRLKIPFLHLVGKHCYSFKKYQARNLYGGSGLVSSSKIGLVSDSNNNGLASAGRSKKIHVLDGVDLHDACQAINCTNIARDLQNEPSNIMTPERFCETTSMLLLMQPKHKKTQKIIQNKKIRIRVLTEGDMRREGLNLVMAIGESSTSARPRFLIIEMIRHPALPTLCLVGKGVTFDAGGLRLKPLTSMVDMKQDKSGAAITVAIMHYLSMVAQKQEDGDAHKINVVAVAPLVENVISGAAVKPGDIIKSHSGRNVEIIDPDAEGRLVIADAISYACKHYKPQYIVDFGTITNFASTVCCDLSAVYYTSSPVLAALVEKLSEETGERVWRLPPWPEYKLHTMSSPVADLRNANFECTRSGSFMAAMFISDFVPDSLASRWIHFDISNNDVGSIHSGNCAMLGMQLVKALATMMLSETRSAKK